MVAKEWRDARWKLLVAAVPVALAAFFLVSPYEDVARMVQGIPGEDPVRIALRDINDLYYFGGLFVLLPLAALLGVTSISGEVGNSAIFLLLSRPVSRTRLLLTKYAVGAGVLLAAAVLGKVLLLTVAAARRYPLGQMRVTEAVLSVLVLWLGVLFVLGTALFVSIIFHNITVSIVACALTLLLVFALPVVVAGVFPMGYAAELSLRLELYTYWMPAYYYYSNGSYGVGGFTGTNFLVCLVSAIIPLLTALWLFRRKAY
ncbi:MAG: Efflux ABC transporter, permease protein [uncultured Rubrobacteraceae bacterium]|uniref:Efflux ABC transporter, permease protein n=1 Tax=uncultured Rubrobacteraceae bacterium TaxID=349277 RepID=A0A6J4QS58_9ACTN|nr:MAG: Efflux ABC transporter, permease protein [uncultured Rubrobacteraceae bacterium]